MFVCGCVLGADGGGALMRFAPKNPANPAYLRGLDAIGWWSQNKWDRVARTTGPMTNQERGSQLMNASYVRARAARDSLGGVA